jgi:hypothetical protein
MSGTEVGTLVEVDVDAMSVGVSCSSGVGCLGKTVSCISCRD